MPKSDRLASGLGQMVIYAVAIVFLLLVLAGVAALVKYAWYSLG